MKKIIIAWFVFIIAGLNHAYQSPYIDSEPGTAEYRLLFEDHDYLIMESTLIASGVEDSDLNQYILKYKNFDTELKTTLSYSNQYETAESVFEMMYDRLMKDYKKDVVTMDELLDYKSFSALNASLLFLSLMELNGYSAQLAVFDDHVRPVVEIDGETVEVETTVILGFDIAAKERAQKNFATKTRLDYQSYTEAEKTIDGNELPALIYYSRSVNDTTSKSYLSALQNALKASVLNSEDEKINNRLTAAYVQYADSLITVDKKYTDAIDILEDAITGLGKPIDQTVIDEYKIAVEKFINQKVKNGYYDAALTIFTEATNLTGLPLTNVQKSMYFDIVYQLINTAQDYDQAYDYAAIAISLYPNAPKITTAVLDGMESVVDSRIASWDSYPDGESMVLKWYALNKSDNMDILLEKYYSEIANLYDANGEQETAMDIIDAGLETLTDNVNLNKVAANIAKTIAESYSDEANYEKEIEYLKVALEYDANDPVIWANLSTAYYNWQQAYAIDDKTRAYEIVTEGLKLLPDDAPLLKVQKQLKIFVK